MILADAPARLNGTHLPVANGRHKRTLAIVGNGMAASRLVDDLLARGATDRWHVRVFGEEANHAYNRILLSRVLGGGHEDDVLLRPRDWRAEGVNLHLGARAEKLDPAARTLVLADGTTHQYDAAVLATGSSAFVPPIPGVKTDDGETPAGVFAYRTVADALAMRRAAERANTAVVLGGGLLGLEAAKALLDRGVHVTVLHLGSHLMDAQLDADGGAMLRRHVEATGLFVRTGTTVAEVVCEDERLAAVKLSDGTTLPADLLVLACGIRPRVEVARASGLHVERGVVVNDALMTAAPGVYAVGECAQHRGRIYGIVAPIWEQTAVLADVLSGANPAARYGGSKLYAKLKVAGIDVASMGRTEPEVDADEVIIATEPRRGVYRKLICRDGRVIGAQFVGDAAAAADLVQRFDRGDALPADRLSALVAPASLRASAGPADPQVCNCNSVNRSAVVAAVSDGAATVEAVGVACRAGTGCGSCKSQVADLIRKATAAVPASV